MQTKTILPLLLAIAVVPLMGSALAANPYFAAYPDEGQIDASHVYMDVDFSQTPTNVSGDVYAIVSAAHAQSDDDLTGTISQLFIKYEQSDDNLYLYSNVFGIDSSGNDYEAWHCEADGGCEDLGDNSTIDDMNAILYWSGGDVQFFVEVNYSSIPDEVYLNDEYDPGNEPNDPSPIQFQSGSDTVNGNLLKFVQWGVESEDAERSNWEVELSAMKTYSGSTGVKSFANDEAITTDPDSGTYRSHITYRDYSCGGSTCSVALYVAQNTYCVDRIGNTDGIIVLEDVDSPNCESPGTTWWS